VEVLRGKLLLINHGLLVVLYSISQTSSPGKATNMLELEKCTVSSLPNTINIWKLNPWAANRSQRFILLFTHF
jgi:hypothetical protein